MGLVEKWRDLGDGLQCTHDDTCCHSFCADELEARDKEIRALLVALPAYSLTPIELMKQIIVILEKLGG